MNPYEELLAANAIYHAAIDGILSIQTDGIPAEEKAEVKAYVGSSALSIFNLMRQINGKLKPYFDPE